MTKYVLIIGASGFIGSYLSDLLLNSEFTPVIYLRKNSNVWRLKNIVKDLIIYYDDINLEKLFNVENFYGVVNLAAYYRKKDNNNDLDDLIDTNIALPVKLLQMSSDHGVSMFLTAGSYFQYSNFTQLQTVRRFSPRNLYAATKNALDGILRYYNEQGSLIVRNLVLYSPYGPKDHPEKLIPYIISNALKGKEISLTDGFQQINPVYVGDVAEAFVSALRASPTNSSENFHLDVVGKRSYSIREIVSIIEELLGKEINKKWGAVNNGSVDGDWCLTANTMETERSINWVAHTDIHAGIKKTLEYYGGTNNDNQ